MKRFMFIFLALVISSSLVFAGTTGFSRCVVDTDCDAGDVCILGDCYTPLECRADSECSANDVCYRGICISPICIVSAECPTDFLCDGGQCIPKECVADSYCSAGKICRNYECIDAPTPMALEEEPEEPEPEVVEAPAVSFSADACPVCDCNHNCQPCEATSCPKLECPACGPFDGELEIPILLFGLVVVAAIGFFAGKMGGDGEEANEDARVERVKSSKETKGGEPDINDEASFRYI